MQKEYLQLLLNAFKMNAAQLVWRLACLAVTRLSPGVYPGLGMDVSLPCITIVRSNDGRPLVATSQVVIKIQFTPPFPTNANRANDASLELETLH